MTLLELLVAVTILASLTTLAASMWGQMRSWVEDNKAISGALQTDRVGRFLQDRWRARTGVVRLDAGDSEGVWIDSRRIEFVSTSPALFPEWPLVRTRFIIEPRPESVRADGESDEPGYDLIYEETRLSGADVIDSERRERLNMAEPARMRLLSGRRLSIDRYTLEDRERGEPPWRSIDALPADMTREQLRRASERGLIEQIETPRAVRISGVSQGEDFEWVFVVRDSR